MQIHFNKKYLLILIVLAGLILVMYSCFQPSKYEILVKDKEFVSVFELEVPESIHLKKDARGTLSMFIYEHGMLSVKKMQNGNSLLFRVFKGEKVYRWDDGSNILVEASISDWNEAANEMDLLSHFEVTDPTMDQKEINNFISLNKIKPAGEKIFVLEKSPAYYEIISFTGSIESATPGMLFGTDAKYKGTIFLEVFSADNNLVLTIENKKDSDLFSESFWYDNYTLLVPNEDLDSIIIARFKP